MLRLAIVLILFIYYYYYFFFFWLASLKLKINDIIQINTENETLEMFGKFKRGKGDGGAKFICWICLLIVTIMVKKYVIKYASRTLCSLQKKKKKRKTALNGSDHLYFIIKKKHPISRYSL